MSNIPQDIHSRIADTILINGKVTTGRGDETCEALAIRGERILSVGTQQAMLALADAHTTIIDVGGRRVIPGLIDSHMHLVRAGLTWNDELHWDGIASLDEALALITRATRQTPPGTWIRVVGGWHPGQFREKRLPTRAELSTLAPQHPVYVQQLYEDAIVNDAALQICNVTAETDDPPGGTFERDGESNPTGRVRGVPAFNYFLQRMGSASSEQQVASTRTMLRAFSRVGLTTAIDAGGLGATAAIYEPIFAIWKQQQLPVRTRLYLGVTERGKERQQIAAWIERFALASGDAYLKVTGAGELIELGYHDLEGLTPFRVPPASRRELYEITRMVAQAGWPMHIHAVWDTTISAILDVWEEVDREFPLAGRRFSIAHADMITESDLARVQRMGIGIAIQDRLVFRSADSSRAWGQEKAHGAPPIRDMLDRGIPVGAGTDSTRVTSYNPWVSLWWMITGCSFDGAPARHTRHCLTRMEALRLYTAGSAWFSCEENDLGTLEPGKLADLVVLSDDYFTVPEASIPTLEAVLTLVGGHPVYTNGQISS
ncbi:MAG TPA: amidohydrolase, partial [Ktedonobacteraceae bacterium]|nr:amidohydrolase [Ktedonobacteraceae bacterium]